MTLWVPTSLVFQEVNKKLISHDPPLNQITTIPNSISYVGFNPGFTSVEIPTLNGLQFSGLGYDPSKEFTLAPRAVSVLGPGTSRSMWENIRDQGGP